MLFCFSLLIPTQMINAQPIICEFCLGSPEMQSTINFTSPVVSPNFTSVSAWYSYKFCDSAHILRIDSVAIPVGESNLDVTSIIGESVKELIYTNPMNFPPNNINEVATWRVVVWSCWHNDSSGIRVLPCVGGACCIFEINVYKSECGISYNSVRLVDSFGSCPEPECKFGCWIVI